MKLLFALVCILGLLSITEAKKGVRNLRKADGIDIEINDPIIPVPKKCDITFYGPNPPPFCSTVTDSNGKPQQICGAVLAPPNRAVLNSSKKSLQMSDFQLETLSFSGTCSCNLELWSTANYKGAYYKYPFSKSANKKIVPSQFWSAKSHSFKVTCAF